MPRTLVLVDVTKPVSDINADTLKRELQLEVGINSTPKGDGIAIYSGDRVDSAPWPWADYAIVIGHVEVGRHHVDEVISVWPADPTNALLSFYSTLEFEEAPPEDEERPSDAFG